MLFSSTSFLSVKIRAIEFMGLALVSPDQKSFREGQPHPVVFLQHIKNTLIIFSFLDLGQFFLQKVWLNWYHSITS